MWLPTPPSPLLPPPLPLAGRGRGRGGPASQPVLARDRPQALNLPPHHPHRPATVAHAARCQETGTLDSRDDNDDVHRMSTVWDWIWFPVFPLLLRQSSAKFFPVTFVGAICWIACFSYLMVWWAHQVRWLHRTPCCKKKQKKHLEILKMSALHLFSTTVYPALNVMRVLQPFPAVSYKWNSSLHLEPVLQGHV